MVNYNPGCMGDYDFDKIAHFAYRRFVEGCDTVTLLQQATSQQEKEEIVLVAMMDVEEDMINSLQLTCRYAKECHMTNCHTKLREILGREYLQGKP